MKISLCPDCEVERPKPIQGYDLHYYIVCSCFDPTPLHSGERPYSPNFQGYGKTSDVAIKDWNEQVSDFENDHKAALEFDRNFEGL